MRKTQQSAVAKKLTEAARYYNDVQTKYKQKYRERMERQYRIGSWDLVDSREPLFDMCSSFQFGLMPLRIRSRRLWTRTCPRFSRRMWVEGRFSLIEATSDFRARNRSSAPVSRMLLRPCRRPKSGTTISRRSNSRLRSSFNCSRTCLYSWTHNRNWSIRSRLRLKTLLSTLKKALNRSGRRSSTGKSREKWVGGAMRGPQDQC